MCRQLYDELVSYGDIQMKKYVLEKIKIQSDGKAMDLYILKPTENKKPKEKTPGILWIHGGGFVTGMAKMIYMSRAMRLVKKYGAVVVTPEYRLSKEAPYPAALNDCYAALKYLKENADELGINSSQIMVGGESAGGGLTIATCMYARDKGEIRIAYQMPLYPMIDDRDTDSSRDNHAHVWNTKRNHKGWKAYLGEFWKKDVLPYAAPARQTDYSNLPPAYTFVGDIEPFYCETLTYIDNLQKAGVDAKVDVYPNWFHAYDMLLPFKKISKKAIAEFEKQYLHAVEHYFAKQK
jgi:acetyl esterase/lipase